MTMKWNIKLKMKNLTGGLTTRHSLPTRMCLNFFSHRTKILKFYCQPTNGTFAFAPTHIANASAKSKEPFFANASNTDSNNKNMVVFSYFNRIKGKFIK